MVDLLSSKAESRCQPVFDETAHNLLRTFDVADIRQELAMRFLGIADPPRAGRRKEREAFAAMFYSSFFSFVAR